MDFYLTDLSNSNKIHFPMNPTSFSLIANSVTQTYDLINVGKVSMPSGNDPYDVSWEGKFPGQARKNNTFVKSWRSPSELFFIIDGWRKKGTKLRLLITQTPVNLDVYINSFTGDYGGGFGDCDYKISFIQAIDLKLYTLEEWKSMKQSNIVKSRPTPPKKSTYTVRNGDSLWLIAQRELKNGARYLDIMKANGLKSTSIKVGQKLVLPC